MPNNNDNKKTTIRKGEPTARAIFQSLVSFADELIETKREPTGEEVLRLLQIARLADDLAHGI